MRKLGYLALALLIVALAAACGSTKKSSSGTTDCSDQLREQGRPQPLTLDQLTIGTDNPAFPPWFGGTPHKPWEVSDPNSGQGYESAVAYAVAKQLGFDKSEVVWKHVPFANSYAPGPKPFDFDINQISFTPARAKVVDFSDSYYDVNQSVVVNKGTPIASVTSVAGLKPYDLGAQLGTTSYQFIKDTIKPTKQPVRLPLEHGSRAGAEEQADRRARRRPADGLLRHRRAGTERQGARPVPGGARRRALRHGLREGQLAPRVREPGAHHAS